MRWSFRLFVGVGGGVFYQTLAWLDSNICNILAF